MRCPGLTETLFVGSSGLYREAVVPRSPGSAAFRGVTLGARRAPNASGESKITTHTGVRRARNNPRFASVHTGRRVFRSRNTRVWLMTYGSTEAPCAVRNPGCAADHCCAVVPGVDPWAPGYNRFAVKASTVPVQWVTCRTEMNNITR